MLVGFSTSDDAGVVRVDDNTAWIQTVDFFTPIVDDPTIFGEIAAVNALSDIYAMGGTPKTALNILCWDESLPPDVLHAILAGGFAKVREAGALLVGGHSVSAPELKYGLAVTGVAHPRKVWSNAGAQPGDTLVLTKPLGTGIATTAIKRGACPPGLENNVIDAMRTLNAASATSARPLDVHACTDITGFGLAGHAWEMAKASRVHLRIHASALPTFDGVLQLAADGHVTRGERTNRAYVGEALSFDGVPKAHQSVIVDPQTSGGLLIALPPHDAAALADQRVGVIVGDVREGDAAVAIDA